MKHNLRSGLLTLALAWFVISGSIVSAQGQVTITTEATLAPDPFTSPSYDAWAANARYAAIHGLNSYGAPGPAQFNTVTGPLSTADNIATRFPSWLGRAYPAAPYASEAGNQAEFVTVINGNGSLINMNNFGATLSSSDPGDALGASFPSNSIDPGDWTYDTDDIGIIFSNGVNISGGYTIVNSGSPAQNVNEIISVGLGNGYFDTNAPGNPVANQKSLNYDAALIASYDFTGTFTCGGASGSATIEFANPFPPIVFGSAASASNGFQFMVEGPVGFVYVIAASEDLKVWWPILYLTSTNPPFSFNDSTATNYARRFYRVGILGRPNSNDVPPAITAAPQSQTAMVRTNVNFSVSATGTSPLSYQWYKNGGALSNGGNVSGATVSTLTLSTVSAADAGSYQVVVSNFVGPLLSPIATLLLQ